MTDNGGSSEESQRYLVSTVSLGEKIGETRITERYEYAIDPGGDQPANS